MINGRLINMNEFLNVEKLYLLFQHPTSLLETSYARETFSKGLPCLAFSTITRSNYSRSEEANRKTLGPCLVSSSLPYRLTLRV